MQLYFYGFSKALADFGQYLLPSAARCATIGENSLLEAKEMRASDYTQIFWDFNGTIFDDLDLGIRTVNTLLRRRGLPTLDSVEIYHSLFGFPVQDYYEKIGLWHKGEDFSPVAHEWMDQYRSEEKTAPVRAGMIEVLDAIRALGIPQGLLSATETEMLREQITYLGIVDYFSPLLGRDDIYAASKSGLAARYREAYPDARVLMIGDTSHDLDTARAGGFDCILICGGHESEDNLRKNGVPVARNPHEVGEMLGLW